MKKLTNQTEIENSQGETGHPPPLKRRRLANLLLSLLVLAVGLAVATYVTRKAPRAQKRAPARVVPVVEVQIIEQEDQRVTVPAMGTVIPAREMELRPQVSGEVVSLHPEFIDGGYITQGSEVLKIDPVDYELAATLAEAKVKDAESVLELAEEEAAAAKEEWGLLHSGDDGTKEELPPLVAKEPQLAAAQARLKAHQAELEQAELDLKRTSVRVPFNAIVRTKNVEVGSLVTPQERIAELVGVDEYWVRISVPVDYLKWISFPKQDSLRGSPVRIVYRSGDERTGEVIKLLGDLESEGRMARVLAAVKDPLGLKNPEQKMGPLLIGEYLRVEIEGSPLKQVFRIPRVALRDNDTIWVVDDDSTLDIRSVKTLWRDTQTVFFKEGATSGDQLVVSDLAAPVVGMKLQVKGKETGDPHRSPQKTGE